MGTLCEVDLVYDVGAHRGEDSDYYLKLGYRVVAIEANPLLAAELSKRFGREIAEGRYTIVDKAVGKADETISFFINKQLSVWGTADPNWAERNKGLGADSEEIKIKSIRFSDVVKQHGCPYYLKIDVEGADMMCVYGLREAKYRPKYLSIESSKTSWRDLLNEFKTMEALGYTKFAVVDQKRHKSGNQKNINGNFIEYNFEKAAAGPFGENLDCVWMTKAQAIRRYIPIFFFYKTMGDNTVLERVLKIFDFGRRILHKYVSWYDTHATRAP